MLYPGVPTVLGRFIQRAVAQVFPEDWTGCFPTTATGFARGVRRIIRWRLPSARRQRSGPRLSISTRRSSCPSQTRPLGRAHGAEGRRQADAEGWPDVLTASVMVRGHSARGPLSSLLSNVVMDEVDRKLESRGVRFARDADDSDICVGSRRAGEQVMDSGTRFIARRLRLWVTRERSR